MDKKVGFIGCGKMAQAMIQGMIDSKLIAPSQIKASANTDKTLKEVQSRFGILVSRNNDEIAEWADILILAVKPDDHQKVIGEIVNSVKQNVVVVTIAAGITLEYISETFGGEIKAVRSMPNTPSLVGEGMSALCFNQWVSAEDLNDVTNLFNGFGRVEVIEEKLMDSIPAISGSSPAYVYMFIEALADGGVKQGLPREKAYKLAAQAVLGAAKMVLETGKHPGELKDQVCTPGGSTIEAVASLEKDGFRSAVISAMDHCTEKTKALLYKN